MCVQARALSSASEVEGVEVTVDLTADSSDTSSLSKVSSNYSKVSEAGTLPAEPHVNAGLCDAHVCQ